MSCQGCHQNVFQFPVDFLQDYLLLWSFSVCIYKNIKHDGFHRFSQCVGMKTNSYRLPKENNLTCLNADKESFKKPHYCKISVK